MKALPCLFPILLPAMAICAMAAEHGVIYLPEGMDEAKAREVVDYAMPDPPEGWGLECIVLPAKCHTMVDARLQAKAIEAGVHQLPCLVLEDDAGPYAVLPLHGLHARDIEHARGLAAGRDRHGQYERRCFNATIYLMCARTALCPQDDPEALDLAVTECRVLMDHPLCTPADKQFIGFYCLYPLLMRQYTQGYDGVHTPYTEAKLLEAIAALEAARDIDPESTIGRKAYDERERLRAARRESRKYE